MAASLKMSLHMILLGFYLFQRIKFSLRGSCPWWPLGGKLLWWPPPSWGWEGEELSLCGGKHREGHAYPHLPGVRSQEPLPHCGAHQTSHAARSHRCTLQITKVLNHCPSPLSPPPFMGRCCRQTGCRPPPEGVVLL